MIKIGFLFKKHEEEGGKFEMVENRWSNRPDLHSFIVLDKLFPGCINIIAQKEHDTVWLDVPEENINKIPEEKVIELVRCGVYYDHNEDTEEHSLRMG